MSTLRPTLLFVHGWAFDASVWTQLRAALADWPHAVADAGYFGATPAVIDPVTGPVTGPDIAPINGPVIAIGHSLGVMRLLRSLPSNCVGVVSINGFPRFSAAPDFEAGVPRRMLDRMMKRLSADPAAVVQDFRERCAEASVLGEPRLEPLARDLELLRDDDQRSALAALPVPLLILAGEDDPIVPAAMTQAAFGGRVGDERHDLEHGGHLLPVSDAPWCARHIAGFIARVAPAA
ncbi:MAG: alpha/beta fold hydrolase [Achromobacter kerstersii]|uniref:alpha/beta fold hydrolase n=1 Tax=Achromobacter kerstersii TaxID=1353890 RepID=UPI003CFCB884